MRKIIGLALIVLTAFGAICSCQNSNEQNNTSLFCCYNYDFGIGKKVEKIGKYSNGKVKLFNFEDGKETEIDFPDKDVERIIKGTSNATRTEWYYIKKGKICNYKKYEQKEAEINELSLDENFGQVLNVYRTLQDKQWGWVIATIKENSIDFYYYKDTGELISSDSHNLPSNYDDIYPSFHCDIQVVSQGSIIWYSYNPKEKKLVILEDPGYKIPNEYDKILSVSCDRNTATDGIVYIKDDMLYELTYNITKSFNSFEKITFKTKIPNQYKVHKRKNTTQRNLMDFMVHFSNSFPNSFCFNIAPDKKRYWEMADDGLKIITDSSCDDDFFVLRLDTNDPSSQAILETIKKKGVIEAWSSVHPAIANGGLVLVEYKDCKEKEKIVKAFKEF